VLIRHVIVKRQTAITAVSNAATHQKASRSAVVGMQTALKSGPHGCDALPASERLVRPIWLCKL